jgi:phospholipid-binding lipoprotein MlaA
VRSTLWLAALVLFCAVRARAARAETSEPLVPGEQGLVEVAAAEPGAVDGPAQAVAESASARADDALELELDDRPTSFPDPLESLNRQTFSLNQAVDRWLFSPVTQAYGYVVPDCAKRSVRHFFANLESPAIFVNDLLQGELDEAATTVARFSVNTTIGLAGLFDPATEMGLEKHNADFGQTLARQGVGSGPFLIVPLLGPTTVRDGIGSLVDVAMQPTIYLLGPAPLFVATVQEGTEGLTLREQHGEEMKRLEQASLDYYVALRNAYYQDRMATLGEAPAGSADRGAITEHPLPQPQEPPT